MELLKLLYKIYSLFLCGVSSFLLKHKYVVWNNICNKILHIDMPTFWKNIYYTQHVTANNIIIFSKIGNDI